MLNSLTPEEYECGGNFERWLGTGKRLDIFLELDDLDYYLAERYFAGDIHIYDNAEDDVFLEMQMHCDIARQIAYVRKRNG